MSAQPSPFPDLQDTVPCAGCNGAGRVSTTVAGSGGYVKGRPSDPAAVEFCRSCHGTGRVPQRYPIPSDAS